MDLKEIKTRYSGKCAKCDREIKQGWTVFFDAKTKNVYCKPCGEILTKSSTGLAEEKSDNKSEAMKLLEDISSQLVLTNDVLASLENQIRDLNTDLFKYDEKVMKIASAIAKKK